MTKEANKVAAPLRKPFTINLTDSEREQMNQAAMASGDMPGRYARGAIMRDAKRVMAAKKKGGE